MNAETIAAIPEPDFHDEDLNIIVYEVLSADGDGTAMAIWLAEAACAVAYAKGLIATLDPEEVH